MRTFDFSPLFRTTVGFDRMANLVDALTREDGSNGYPPYNIEKLSDDGYRITMAVAGFSDSDLTLTQHDNTLTVVGKQAERADEGKYLYRGIAARAFERRFQLADFIKVKGAELVNGLLHIELERVVPEEKKPRQIAINGGSAPRALPQAA